MPDTNQLFSLFLTQNIFRGVCHSDDTAGSLLTLNKTIKDEVDAVGLDGDIHIHINCSSYHLKVKPSIFHFHKTGAMTVLVLKSIFCVLKEYKKFLWNQHL